MNPPPMPWSDLLQKFNELTKIINPPKRIISLYYERTGDMYEQKFEDDIITISANNAGMSERMDSYKNEDSQSRKNKILDSAIDAGSDAINALFIKENHVPLDI